MREGECHASSKYLNYKKPAFLLFQHRLGTRFFPLQLLVGFRFLFKTRVTAISGTSICTTYFDATGVRTRLGDTRGFRELGV